MNDEYNEVYGYYDGPLSGVYFSDGELFYYSLQDDSPLYPIAADPDGRIYDVWRIEHEPFAHEVDDINWQPPSTPFGTVTEAYLHSMPDRQTK